MIFREDDPQAVVELKLLDRNPQWLGLGLGL
jgi:hypothetical protein